MAGTKAPRCPELDASRRHEKVWTSVPFVKLEDEGLDALVR
jgi:hypothetical protein